MNNLYNKRRRIKKRIAELKEMLKVYDKGTINYMLKSSLAMLEDELKNTYKNTCMS